MKKFVLLFITLVVIIGTYGCIQPVSGDVIKSDKPREASPNVAPADLSLLVDGNNDFAFRLYKSLKTADGNLFYSPYSISAALAMTYAGARSGTETAIAKSLSFTLPQDRLHPGFNSIDLQLKQRGQGAQGKDGKGFRLNVVNAIWGQKGYQFLDSYLDVLAMNYGAGLRTVDFIADTEASRKTINDWVSEQTEQRIKDLLPQGSVSNLTRLVLTNAIYFNAAWQYPFKKEATQNGQFFLLDGKQVTVPMMRETEPLRYFETADFQAIELPYDGRQLAMTILAPKSGQFGAFEGSLDARTVRGIVEKLQSRQVALTMPKFEYDSSFGLKKTLTDLGMGLAFTPDADFSGMNGKKDLFIHDVLHKAFVAVDEAGTEAAAATGVIVGVTSAPAQPIEVKIDRPFIFMIRDIPTGSIIFVGRVLNPS